MSSTLSLFIDNQPTILALSKPLRAAAGLHLRRDAHRSLDALLNTHPFYRLAHLVPSSSLPISFAAVRQRIKGKLEQARMQPPPPDILHRHHPTFNPRETKRALAALPGPKAPATAQLRANHSPLNNYLH
ncbi:hypothetical protein CROQUDRAFT_101143 [Cronartium quercuum f. sp. fusiforme G11]|uniref:Uncharacterized protein n=1 Tax=Cronartium quercuum f. sp. fusiforme G11 TaxID=708437 RepID=A0A9P6N5K8_9BASI|nr:hypothetical protein CROQUDRAFT_101143 [Cronartium quercuum f. sp. fusiforme G11]